MSEEGIDIPVILDSIELNGGGDIRKFSRKNGSFNGRGKVLSRYGRPSMGSCHDLCKHAAEQDPEMVKSPTFMSRRVKEIQQGLYLDKIPSRYGRPSLGSCHDFCKFGEEQALEMKARSPVSMSKGNTEIQDVCQYREKIATPSEKKKKQWRISGIASPRSKTRNLDDPVVTIEVSSWTKKETVSPKPVSLRHDIFAEYASDPMKLDDPVVEKEVSSLTGKDTVSSKCISFFIEEVDVPMNNASDTKILKDHDVKREVSSLKKKRTSLKEIDVSVKHAGKQSKPSPRPVQRSPKCDQADRKTRKDNKMGDLSTNSPRASNSRSKTKTSEETRRFVRGGRKVLATPSVSSATKLKKVTSKNAENSNEQNGVSVLRNLKTVGKPKPEQSSLEDVPEKILHTVEPSAKKKTERPIKTCIDATDLIPPSSSSSPLERAQSIPHSPRFSPSSTEKKYLKRTQSMTHGAQSPGNQISDLETESKNVFKKGRTLGSEDEGSSNQKLTFQRGTVVDIQPVEDTTPRRLEYKQREVGDNENDKGEDGSPKVVLRHQELEEEKECGGLYNNVIEETVSKLVVIKKSKVKALVGAFESLSNLR